MRFNSNVTNCFDSVVNRRQGSTLDVYWRSQQPSRLLGEQAERRGAEHPYSIYPDGLTGRFYSSEPGRLRLIPALASETIKPRKSRNTVRKHRCYRGKPGLVIRLLASHPFLWVEGITTPQTPERFGFQLQKFSMISQSINSKSKLADYKNYHKQSKIYIQELESKLDNKVLSLEDYRKDLSRRLATHDKEFALALRDAALIITSAKKQVVELSPIN